MKSKQTFVYIAAAVITIALIAWAATRERPENEPPQVQPAAEVAQQTPPPVVPQPLPEQPIPQQSVPQPVPPPSGAPFKPSLQTDTASAESVRRMNVDELNERMQRGEVVVLDVRDADSYAAAHIPGSVHIPLPQVASELAKLPRGKPVVTYCT